MLKLPFNRWITYALLLVLAAAVTAMWAASWYQSELSDGMVVLLSLGSAALSVGAFGALCVLCRCRFCGHKLFWHAVGERDHGDSLGWFFAARHCPRCGRSRNDEAAPADVTA
jgi:hypothetical protein